MAKIVCPHCQNDDEDMIEIIKHLDNGKKEIYCDVCAITSTVQTDD